MTYLTEAEAERLLEEAKATIITSYSPYSNFAVGAAVQAQNGLVYRAANVENASYSLTLCAERIAMGYAIAAGNRAIKAIAVYADVPTITPCGNCRQFIHEFGADIIVVFLHNGEIEQKTIGELLPYAFSKANMEGTK
jgi:cytidine deaminase